MQVKRAQKASGIEDRCMKTSPFERGEDFISSDARYKKPGAGPGLWLFVTDRFRFEELRNSQSLVFTAFQNIGFCKDIFGEFCR